MFSVSTERETHLLVFNPSTITSCIFATLKTTQVNCDYTYTAEQATAIRFKSVFQEDRKSASKRLGISEDLKQWRS